MNYGGMLCDSNDTTCSLPSNTHIEGFCSIGTHSVDPGPFGNVELNTKMQYQYTEQAESYFCSKQCLFDWFQRKLKNLPEPGTHEYNR